MLVLVNFLILASPRKAGVHKQWGRGDTQGARRALSSGSRATAGKALSQTEPSVLLSARLGKLMEREILADLVDWTRSCRNLDLSEQISEARSS